MNLKYLFAIITVITVGGIQIGAFILGIDGHVFTSCIGIITALIGYILGTEINVKKTNQELEAIYKTLSNFVKRLEERK